MTGPRYLIHGDIVVLSVDARMADDSCGAERTSDSEDYWEGLRIFDVSDPANPEYVSAVETKCGSHTHSLAPSADGEDLYVYVSSYFPSDDIRNCQPPHDLISVVHVPVDDPSGAEVVSTPVLFPDGGYEGDDRGSYTETSGCHDITTYVEHDLAAGACMGDGILMDISDRENPEVISNVRDVENFAFWHSATFNNDATKVVFTDELGGGGMATCTNEFPDTFGANAIYDIVDGELVHASYYKIPRINSEEENCVAHNGSLIPVEGRDLMVQSWYQGGTSVFDFTDSENPEEIAWFDRGEGISGGGTWSSYWYNGYVYSSDLSIGFDTFKLDDSIDGDAMMLEDLNPQGQTPFPVGDEEPRVPPRWAASTVYDTGDLVALEDAIFEALWWTRNQEPGDPNGPWSEIGEPTVCGEEEYPAWAASTRFDGGESVVHEDVLYEAQWYSRNQEPGDPNGPWTEVSSC
ncbi:hypothetical protein [Nesterenkonia sedimenti]|uniref:hypothetical protein n=1 Tax=Nesterenkonia sedimenti TaxID=1463632 RepID=UPI001E3EF67D|nr:hypothetical protein [Nesterenkonia sedimenti]